ncbi:MAG: hypothetical protein ACRENE_35475, partial [Polyangiaceae bacterium]
MAVGTVDVKLVVRDDMQKAAGDQRLQHDGPPLGNEFAELNAQAESRHRGHADEAEDTERGADAHEGPKQPPDRKSLGDAVEDYRDGEHLCVPATGVEHRPIEQGMRDHARSSQRNEPTIASRRAARALRPFAQDGKREPERGGDERPRPDLEECVRQHVQEHDAGDAHDNEPVDRREKGASRPEGRHPQRAEEQG